MIVKEVRELLLYRRLIYLLVKRDLVNRYRRSILGLLWAVLQPLLYMMILNFVFSTAFGRDDPKFTIYILTGILYWMFYSGGTVQGLNALNLRAGIIKKNSIKRSVFVVVATLSAAVNFMIGIGVLFIVLFAIGEKPIAHIVWLPVVLLSMTLFVCGVALCLSVLAVRFRDLHHLYSSSLTLLMYMTPIFYPADIVPESFKGVYDLNPNLYFVNGFRYAFFDVGYELSHVWIAAALGLATYIIGVVVFRALSRNIIFYL